jgi:hypothetical protein
MVTMGQFFEVVKAALTLLTSGRSWLGLVFVLRHISSLLASDDQIRVDPPDGNLNKDAPGGSRAV